LYLSTVSVPRFTKKKFPDFPLAQGCFYVMPSLNPTRSGWRFNEAKKAEPPRLAGASQQRGSAFLYGPHFAKNRKMGTFIVYPPPK
jgi:hypothetical protein